MEMIDNKLERTISFKIDDSVVEITATTGGEQECVISLYENEASTSAAETITIPPKFVTAIKKVAAFMLSM